MKKQLIHILATAALIITACDNTSTTTLLNGDFLPADTSLPNILSPEEGDTVLNLTADLRWTAKEGAEYYSIEVAIDEAFAQQITGSPFTVEVPNTFYKLTLPSAGTYYWRIRASVTASGQYASSYFDAKEDCLYVYFPYDAADPDAKPDDTGKTGNLDSPYQTINRALAEAYRLGISKVRVASRGEISAGNFAAYEEYFVFREGVSVQGGFNADFSERHDFSTGLENNPYETRLEGKYSQSIKIEEIYSPTLIEGLSIKTTKGMGLNIQNCGIDLIIRFCLIVSEMSYGGSTGLYILNSSSRIVKNLIKSSNNVELGLTAGLENIGGDPEIINNCIISGSMVNNGGYSYGVHNDGDCILINNTIISGVTSYAGSENTATSTGLYSTDTNNPVVINNIIITIDENYERYGIQATGGFYYYNCIYGNGGTDHTGITLGTGNVTVDPLLDADYKLTASSPSTVTGGGVIDPFDIVEITPLDEYLLDIEGAARTPDYVADSATT
ncbi:MAG TPA: hypothetical protein PK573_07205, partial [Spirochaetota bacterium]|nr:hypothetical protein [Spirochaetota bacterium]